MVHQIPIHPYSRQVDDCPSRPSQLKSEEVKGGNIVGVVLESAVDASEEALAPPVCSADAATSWTGYRGVFRRNAYRWDPPFKCFVFDKELQSFECPAMEVPILALPMLSRVVYSSQLIHNKYVAFPEAVHESSTHLVQNGVCTSPLPSAQPFQLPFGGGRAFVLERGAELPKTMPFRENLTAFSLEAVRGDEKVLYTNIDTNWVITFKHCNFPVNRDMEKEGFISVTQDGMGGFNIFKKFSLIFANAERNSHPLLNRRDGGEDSVWLVDKPEKPLIQIHGEAFEPKKFVSSPLVGLRNSVSGSNGKVCWKIELLSSISVGDVVEGDGVKDPALKGYLRDVIACISKSLKGCEHLLRIFSRWFKLAYDGLRERHTKAYMQTRYLHILQFLPRLKPWVSLEVFS